MTQWTPSETAHLENYWRMGLPTLEIGRLLKRSKNSVIGHAHRIKLAKRDNPVGKFKTLPKSSRTVKCLNPLCSGYIPQGFGHNDRMYCNTACSKQAERHRVAMQNILRPNARDLHKPCAMPRCPHYALPNYAYCYGVNEVGGHETNA